VTARFQVCPLVLDALHADRIARADVARVLRSADRTLLPCYHRLTGSGVRVGRIASGNQHAHDAQAPNYGKPPRQAQVSLLFHLRPRRQTMNACSSCRSIPDCFARPAITTCLGRSRRAATQSRGGASAAERLRHGWSSDSGRAWRARTSHGRCGTRGSWQNCISIFLKNWGE